VSVLLGLFNATLTAAASAGQAPDYDRAAVAGTSKFAGSQLCFLSESEERADDNPGSDWIIRRTILVDPELDVTWVPGDTVTFTRDGSVTPETGIVRRFATSGTDVSGLVTRLILEDA
jgi:hypothetical protein